tara:strand:- start:38 stop:235 length:198 start_codon:yes stop_codon:yes gene_type:complete
VERIVKQKQKGITKKRKEEATRRLTICLSCPHFKPTLKRCGICKCFMYLKIFVKNAKCPDSPSRW